MSPGRARTALEGYRDLIRRGDVDGFVLSETNYEDPRVALLSHDWAFRSFRLAAASPRDLFAWVDVDGASGIGDAVQASARVGSSTHRTGGVARGIGKR